jgi:hypothetical protein
VSVRESSNTGSTSGQATEPIFGKDGDRVIVLLGGGSKKRQQRDIATAIELWKDYKQRKESHASDS